MAAVAGVRLGRRTLKRGTGAGRRLCSGRSTSQTLTVLMAAKSARRTAAIQNEAQSESLAAVDSALGLLMWPERRVSVVLLENCPVYEIIISVLPALRTLACALGCTKDRDRDTHKLCKKHQCTLDDRTI